MKSIKLLYYRFLKRIGIEIKHVVCINNLRVFISHQNGEWFAQGVEIDYAASGNSLEDVQNRFQRGLRGTVDVHLKEFGDLEKLLKYPPKDELRKLHNQLKNPDAYTLDMVSFHDLPEFTDLEKSTLEFPFTGIAYLESRV